MATLRHYEPTGAGTPPCGAKDGWWIKTPRYVTCPKCQKHLPRTVHLLVSAGKSRCGGKVTAATATPDEKLVSCSRCIPRPSANSKTVHMAWVPGADPLAEKQALCNLPYAKFLTDDPKEVTCGLCQTRWAPQCPFCGNAKPSRDPVCRQPKCRQLHRKEMISGRRTATQDPAPA